MNTTNERAKGPNIHMTMKTGNSIPPIVTFDDIFSFGFDDMGSETDGDTEKGWSGIPCGVVKRGITLDVVVAMRYSGSSPGAGMVGVKPVVLSNVSCGSLRNVVVKVFCMSLTASEVLGRRNWRV